MAFYGLRWPSVAFCHGRRGLDLGLLCGGGGGGGGTPNRDHDGSAGGSPPPAALNGGSARRGCRRAASMAASRPPARLLDRGCSAAYEGGDGAKREAGER